MANSTAKTSKPVRSFAGRVRSLAVGALLLGSAAYAADRFEEERESLAKAKAQAVVAEERAAKIEKEADAEEVQAEAARKRAASVAARIQATEADMSAAEARIRLIEKMREEQRARLAARQEPVVRLLAAIQMISRRPTGLMILQPQSASRAVHMRAVLAEVLPELRKRTAGLRAEIVKAERLKLDAQKAVAILDSARERLAGQKAELVALSARHRTEADRLTGDALSEQDRAIGFGEKARDIASLMKNLEEDAGDRARLASLPGPLLRPARPGDAASPSDTAPQIASRIPYRLPVSGALISGLGDFSEAGVRTRGITISPRADAIAVAPSAGRIVFAGPFKGYGHIIILDHGSGWTSLITGMAALYVKVGEQMIQGSPLGRAGGDRPMVTVELRKDGVPVDIAALMG